MTDTTKAKRAVAEAGALQVQSGMIVGLGSGSTAAFFIHALGNRCREGLTIRGVPTSLSSQKLAEKESIPLLDLEKFPTPDLTIDGADRVDPQKQLIKGAGGAHLKEKILAFASRSVIILIDWTKEVDTFRGSLLPVEIASFGRIHTQAQLNERGFRGEWRKGLDGSLFVTEGNNLLLDIFLPAKELDLYRLEKELLSIPGILSTGLFLDLKPQVWVGLPDGSVSHF